MPCPTVQIWSKRHIYITAIDYIHQKSRRQAIKKTNGSDFQQKLMLQKGYKNCFWGSFSRKSVWLQFGYKNALCISPRACEYLQHIQKSLYLQRFWQLGNSKTAHKIGKLYTIISNWACPISPIWDLLLFNFRFNLIFRQFLCKKII